MLGSQERWFGEGRGACERSFATFASPVAGFGAFVAVFSAVVETVFGTTGLTFEGEKIELVAVFVVAESADCFDVFVFVHDVGCLF